MRCQSLDFNFLVFFIASPKFPDIQIGADDQCREEDDDRPGINQFCREINTCQFKYEKVDVG